MPTNNFQGQDAGLLGPYSRMAAVTPSDSVDISFVSAAIYVGGAGALVVTPFGGTSNVTFAAVPAGTTIPIRVTRVLSAGTAATSIVALG